MSPLNSLNNVSYFPNLFVRFIPKCLIFSDAIINGILKISIYDFLLLVYGNKIDFFLYIALETYKCIKLISYLVIKKKFHWIFYKDNHVICE